jgi:hypothetical protein
MTPAAMWRHEIPGWKWGRKWGPRAPVTHTRPPKPFAVKFLRGLSTAEPELLMRFQREAEITSRSKCR